MSYLAYGIDLSRIRWKNDAAITLMNKMYLPKESNKEIYLKYCKDNDINPNDDESKEEFVEFFDDGSFNDGIEGLLMTIMNDNVFTDDFPLIYEDYCLCVAATLPTNKLQKEIMPTEEMIRKTMNEYLSPLIKENIEVTWLIIHDNEYDYD